MKLTNLNLTDRAAEWLDNLPARTKSSFASCAIEATFAALGWALETSDPDGHPSIATGAKHREVVFQLATLCADAFGRDCVRVGLMSRGRVEALKHAHGIRLDDEMTGAALALATVIHGSPKAAKGLFGIGGSS